ncbi:hypothetical protein CCAX7_48490 [Capsulimonas corticalis]|uniref:Uncharacterized protein n=1 Tax=Capsulimonas corticalis TaxID=2219043 RepID=A0A402CQ73_9BACT|nr:beta-L-arabinofuranosidase domain-containing protein [Capsulimonas corticalis]BDI32798.1 hypothetical protein CCAX7_48490 [Capsulimonas corticalis]
MLRRQFIQGCFTVAAAMTAAPLAGRAAGAKGAVRDPKKSRALTAVPIRHVTIHDDFWSPKLAVWRGVTINDCFDKFEKTGALDNFDRVAARAEGGHHGDPWWDGLIYEMIAAASDFLIAQPDPALEKRLDGYIDRIAAAAAVDPDGYLHTAVTLSHVAARWSDPSAPGDMHDDRFPHTVYNAGCLVEAGVHHYQATGKTKLLDVATRMANYMCRIMGPPPRQNIIPGHAIAELAFVELYLLYRDDPKLKARIGQKVDEKRYLELAEYWIENRGNHAGRADMGVYDQDDRSALFQPTMEGHAVRSALLAAGIALAASVNGRPEYYATAQRWWSNMVAAKMYVTGGLGAIPSTEGFGPDYELPNFGYAETCAAVGGAFFSRNLGLATGQAEYFDVLERELYNGALCGVSVAGTSYFYTNYLASGPERRRWDWDGCPCCPPMFLKLMGALPGGVYATDLDGVYVNLFTGSEAKIAQDGWDVTLRQTTGYPWNGGVRLDLAPKKPARFALSLRVPAWSSEASFRVNGKSVTPSIVRGYARIERTWRAGDSVEMNLPMPARRLKADPRIAADVGRVALMCGPIVYCLEGLDNGGHVESLVLAPSSVIRAEHRPDLLGGVTVLRGDAHVARARMTAAHPEGEPAAEAATFTALPFYTNTNREPTHMAVWIADDRQYALPLTTAAAATPSASRCNPSDTVWALNNARQPRASDDETIPRFTWWDHRGTSEWVQYDFPSAQEISGVEVYWWDEECVHRDCRVPQSWSLQYQDGGEWRSVEATSPYGVEVDKFNRVTFPSIRTTALRLVAQMQTGWSAGILQWRVLEG